MGRVNARWLGSIPNRLTNFLNTTNNPIDRKVRNMFNPAYCPNLPFVLGKKGDYELILDNGEIINVTRNTNLAAYLAHSCALPMPRANTLSDLVRSACKGSERAKILLARLDWQIIQLTNDTLPITL